MAITFLEPGGDATFNVATAPNGGFWNTVATGTTLATDFVHGGHIKSIKFRPGTFDEVRLVTSNNTGTRISFYIYLVALPTTSSSTIMQIQVASSTNTIGIRITTSGVLQLFNTTTQIGTNGATLSTGQWYRISLAYTITSSTVNRFELFVNGISSISITNATVTTTGNVLWFGNYSGNAGLDIRMSDFYIDNSSSLTDTGDIWVTAKRPVSNGTLNQFTTQIGSGDSGYGSGHSPQVNERPVSITNGWSLSNTTKATEEYTIEAKNVGDIDISNATIVDYMGWIYAKKESAGTSPVHNIIVGGTATAKTLTTSAVTYLKMANSSTYPAGGTDIGIDAQFTTTPVVTSLYECGIVVAYIPPPVITAQAGFLYLMV